MRYDENISVVNQPGLHSKATSGGQGMQGESVIDLSRGALDAYLLRKGQALHVRELGHHMIMLSTVDLEEVVCFCHRQDTAARCT